ncbi:MAG: COG4315 family predicted lipoprotein [Acidimicrobiales bacterium]
MTNDRNRRTQSNRYRHVGGALVGAALLVVAACASSSKTTTTGTTANSAVPSSAPSTGVTISTADVPGVGTVLVNAKDGRTLYLLTSEQGGKLTCTDDNGCTKVWPDTELPPGVTAANAGGGADASRLGTVKSATGSLYVTYGGWPLYTYAGDSGPAQAKGQGITSFGGTWYVISPAGNAVTAKATSAPAGSSGGY